MNERFNPDTLQVDVGTTAAEGMRRRAWSLAEIEAMVEAGIIDEDERFELIGGEVVPMSPKGSTHEWVKIEVNAYLQTHRPNDLTIGQETTLRLDDYAFLEPDFCIFPRAIMPGDMRGYDVLLAIEIADSSLSYDRGRKIGIYSAYGIPEVWVIDAKRLETRVHRSLGAEGYRNIFGVAAGEDLVSQRRPDIRLNLAALGLTPVTE